MLKRLIAQLHLDCSAGSCRVLVYFLAKQILHKYLLLLSQARPCVRFCCFQCGGSHRSCVAFQCLLSSCPALPHRWAKPTAAAPASPSRSCQCDTWSKSLLQSPAPHFPTGCTSLSRVVVFSEVTAPLVSPLNCPPDPLCQFLVLPALLHCCARGPAHLALPPAPLGSAAALIFPSYPVYG